MNQVLQHPAVLRQLQTNYPSIGVLKGFNSKGCPEIQIIENKQTIVLSAKTVFKLSYNDIGKELLLTFVNGDEKQAIIIGLLQPPLFLEEKTDTIFDCEQQETGSGVEIKSGLSSIKLMPTGKIEIKGVELQLSCNGKVRINGEKVLLNCDKEK